jgi:hypothetical protein
MEKSQLIKENKALEDFKLPVPSIPEDYVLLKVDELDKEPKIIRKRSSEIRTLKITKK